MFATGSSFTISRTLRLAGVAICFNSFPVVFGSTKSSVAAVNRNLEQCCSIHQFHAFVFPKHLATADA